MGEDVKSPRLETLSPPRATGGGTKRQETQSGSGVSGAAASEGGGEAGGRIPDGPHTNPHTPCAVTSGGAA